MDEFLAYANHYQGAIVGLATVCVAAVGIMTALLTFNLARENRLLRKAGTEPEVVAYLTSDLRYKNMVNFVLANIGQGPARNVSFTFECDQADFAAHKVAVSNKSTRKSIGTLPQGERIDSFFGVGHQLFAEPRLKPFSVKVGYDDLKGKRRSAEYELDVSQFDGLITLGSPAEHEMAEAMKKIASHIGRLITGSQRLKVETMTAEQVRKMNKKHAESARAMMDREIDREQLSLAKGDEPNSSDHDQSENSRDS